MPATSAPASESQAEILAAPASDEPLRRRRSKHKHRQKRFEERSGIQLSLAAKAWIVIAAAALIFGASGIWALQLIRENDGLRAKLAEVTYSSKAKIEHLEAQQKEPKIKLADPVELSHEKFNSTEAPEPTVVRTPLNGAVVVSIVVPSVPTERWDVILRDSLQNAKAKVTVTSPASKRISLVLTNLAPSTYEIHAKAREGNTAATYRYLFTLD